MKTVTLLHFTDTHAQLETHPEYIPGAVPEFQMMGGFARLKTAIDREIASSTGPMFVADGGDEFQGSGPASWSQGEVIRKPLNALGADVYVPGNWDPAYGPKRFKELMQQLTAKVICFNFHDKASGKRLFPAATTLEKQGVRVAFLGLTDIKASERHPPVEYDGMDTTRLDGLREFVQKLKNEEKPHIIVAVTHTGLTVTRMIAREVPEINVILSGHTHERTYKPIYEGKTIIVESAAMGSFLGRLDLTLANDGTIAERQFKLIAVTEESCEENPTVKQLTDESLKSHRERANEVVCRTLTPVMRYDVLETNADDFITDAVRDAAGVDIGFSNGFRFGIPILAGKMTEGDLWNLLPMEAKMKKGWVTGQELWDYLENELELVYSSKPMNLSGGWGPRASGMQMIYEMRAPKEHRLREVRIGERKLDRAAKYTVASCEREGEPLDVICRIKDVHDVEVLEAGLHAVIRRYLKKHQVISPRREGRAFAIDLAPVVFSQDAVVSDAQRGSYLPDVRGF